MKWNGIRKPEKKPHWWNYAFLFRFRFVRFTCRNGFFFCYFVRLSQKHTLSSSTNNDCLDDAVVTMVIYMGVYIRNAIICFYSPAHLSAIQTDNTTNIALTYWIINAKHMICLFLLMMIAICHWCRRCSHPFCFPNSYETISVFSFGRFFIYTFQYPATLQLSWLSANKNQTVVHYTNQFPFRRFIFQFESGVTVIACALCLAFWLFKLWNNIPYK